MLTVLDRIVSTTEEGVWCNLPRLLELPRKPSPHEPLPPDNQDMSPQEQASLRKWLDGGLTTAAVTSRRVSVAVAQ